MLLSVTLELLGLGTRALDHRARHAGRQEGDEGDAEHELDAADQASDIGRRDDVAVADGRHGLQRPPQSQADRGKSCGSTMRSTTAPTSASRTNVTASPERHRARVDDLAHAAVDQRFCGGFVGHSAGFNVQGDSPRYGCPSLASAGSPSGDAAPISSSAMRARAAAGSRAGSRRAASAAHRRDGGGDGEGDACSRSRWQHGARGDARGEDRRRDLRCRATRRPSGRAR